MSVNVTTICFDPWGSLAYIVIVVLTEILMLIYNKLNNFHTTGWIFLVSCICPNVSKSSLCKYILFKHNILDFKKILSTRHPSVRWGQTEKMDRLTWLSQLSLFVPFDDSAYIDLSLHNYVIYLNMGSNNGPTKQRGLALQLVSLFVIFSASTIERFPLSSIEHHDRI